MSKVKGMFRRGRLWWLRYTPAPGEKQQRVPLGTAIEETAAVKALAILHSAPLQPSGEFERELEDYLTESVAAGLLSKNFAPSRRYVLKAFARSRGVSRLQEITVAEVQGWLEDLRAAGGRKDSTIESYLFHLRAFCSWLVEHHKLRENAAAKVKLGKVARVVKKDYVQAAVVRRLIAEAPNDEMRFILYAGFHCGLRKLEIIEMRRTWLQFGAGKRRGCLNIGKTPTFSPKDRDERTVPLSREFEEFLGGYVKRCRSVRTFCCARRRPMGNTNTATTLTRLSRLTPRRRGLNARRTTCGTLS